MSPTLSFLASAAALALLLAAIGFLRRRSFLVRQLTFPATVAAVAAAIEIVGRLGPGPIYPWLAPARSWVLLFLGLITILRVLALFFFDVHLRGQRGVRLPPLLPAVAMALIYLVTALVTLKVSFPAFDISPLLATSAVTSLVLGLALQPILANFFAGLVISLERPFRINDWIRVGDQEGRVVAITWRTTHLRTRDNDNIVIPNGKLADERVHNFYYPHPLHVERVRVQVHYREPPYRVRRVLVESVTGVAGILDKPSPEAFLIAFEESAISYELRVWIDDVANAPRIASDLRARIWEELHKAGMTIPYPTRTVELAPRRRAAAAAPALRAATAADSPTATAAPAGAAATATPLTAVAATGTAATATTITAATNSVAAPPPARPRTAARLYVLEGPERGQALDLGAEPTTIGRSRTCTLPLSDPNASKEHLRIEWENGSWVASDLGSRFGTRVNGQTVARAALAPLDRIAAGDTVMIFESDR